MKTCRGDACRARQRLQGGRAAQPYRLMVVDDSAVIRGLLTRSLEADPEVEVLATAQQRRDGARTRSPRHDVEIVMLDIEMPVMDGLTALPKLLRAEARAQGDHGLDADPARRRYQHAGAGRRRRRLSAQARRHRRSTSADEFKRELLAKVKALGQARRRAAGAAAPQLPARAPASPRRRRPSRSAASWRCATAAREPPEVLAIGSSTGGPQALFTCAWARSRAR